MVHTAISGTQSNKQPKESTAQVSISLTSPMAPWWDTTKLLWSQLTVSRFCLAKAGAGTMPVPGAVAQPQGSTLIAEAA